MTNDQPMPDEIWTGPKYDDYDGVNKHSSYDKPVDGCMKYVRADLAPKPMDDLTPGPDAYGRYAESKPVGGGDALENLKVSIIEAVVRLEDEEVGGAPMSAGDIIDLTVRMMQEHQALTTPDHAAQVGDALRTLRQRSYVDGYVAALNRKNPEIDFPKGPSTEELTSAHATIRNALKPNPVERGDGGGAVDNMAKASLEVIEKCLKSSNDLHGLNDVEVDLHLSFVRDALQPAAPTERGEDIDKAIHYLELHEEGRYGEINVVEMLKRLKNCVQPAQGVDVELSDIIRLLKAHADYIEMPLVGLYDEDPGRLEDNAYCARTLRDTVIKRLEALQAEKELK